MKPGQSIQIQLTDEERRPLPIGNVMVQLELFTKGNYRYGFEAGRTDESGRLIVSYDDVEERRRRCSQQNLMDYNTRLEECDPTIRIVILPEQELLLRQQKVLQSYGREPDWAAFWPSNARVKAQEQAVELTGQVVKVEILTRSA
jgi:hypothetical protein